MALTIIKPGDHNATQRDIWAAILNAALDAIVLEVNNEELNRVGGSITSVTRDSAGRVSSLTETGIVQSFTRDSFGRILTITTGGIVTTVTRNSSGQITGVA